LWWAILKSYDTSKNIQKNLNAYLEVEKTQNKTEKTCKHCGINVPKHLICCWNCGNVLDQSLEKLVKKKKVQKK
jgi:hypothetical protein